MKFSSNPGPVLARSVLAAGIVLGLAAVCGFSAPASAAQRNTTVTGPNGKSVQRDVTRSKGAVSSSVTGANGKTATRSVERGNGQAAATVTGPNGRQWQRSSTHTSAGTTSTVTGPNGGTATRSTPGTTGNGSGQ